MSFCSKHPDKCVDTFCKKHKEAICVACLLKDHQKCIKDIEEISKTTDTAEQVARNIVNKFGTLAENIELWTSKRKSTMSMLADTEKRLISGIKKIRIKLIEQVNSKATDALKLVSSVIEDQMERVDNDEYTLESLNDRMLALRDQVIQIHTVMNSQSEHNVQEVFRTQVELQNIERGLHQIRDSHRNMKVIFYISNEIQYLYKNFNTFGELLIEDIDNTDRPLRAISAISSADLQSMADTTQNTYEVDNSVFALQSIDARNSSEIYDSVQLSSWLRPSPHCTPPSDPPPLPQRESSIEHDFKPTSEPNSDKERDSKHFLTLPSRFSLAPKQKQTILPITLQKSPKFPWKRHEDKVNRSVSNLTDALFSVDIPKDIHDNKKVRGGEKLDTSYTKVGVYRTGSADNVNFLRPLVDNQKHGGQEIFPYETSAIHTRQKSHSVGEAMLMRSKPNVRIVVTPPGLEKHSSFTQYPSGSRSDGSVQSAMAENLIKPSPKPRVGRLSSQDSSNSSASESGEITVFDERSADRKSMSESDLSLFDIRSLTNKPSQVKHSHTEQAFRQHSSMANNHNVTEDESAAVQTRTIPGRAGLEATDAALDSNHNPLDACPTTTFYLPKPHRFEKDSHTIRNLQIDSTASSATRSLTSWYLSPRVSVTSGMSGSSSSVESQNLGNNVHLEDVDENIPHSLDPSESLTRDDTIHNKHGSFFKSLFSDHGSHSHYSLITGLCITEDQRFFICDSLREKLEVFQRGGELVSHYQVKDPFGCRYLHDGLVVVTSRSPGSVCIFDANGELRCLKEERVDGDVYGVGFSNGFISVCCLDCVTIYTESLAEYKKLKPVHLLKKNHRPLFEGVKYCELDWGLNGFFLYASDDVKDEVTCIDVNEAKLIWITSVSSPRDIAMQQGLVYVATKRRISVLSAATGVVTMELRAGVPRRPISIAIHRNNLYVSKKATHASDSKKIRMIPLPSTSTSVSCE